MDQEVLKKLEEQGRRIEEIWQSVEKTRKYFFWTLVITLAFIALPIIGLAFAIPTFLNAF